MPFRGCSSIAFGGEVVGSKGSLRCLCRFLAGSWKVGLGLHSGFRI